MGRARQCPLFAQARGMKCGKRVGKVWEEDGKSQAMPTLFTGKRYEGWEKGVRKVGKARQCPPFAQATGMRGGKRVFERWEKSQVHILV